MPTRVIRGWAPAGKVVGQVIWVWVTHVRVDGWVRASRPLGTGDPWVPVSLYSNC